MKSKIYRYSYLRYAILERTWEIIIPQPQASSQLAKIFILLVHAVEKAHG